MSNRGGNVAFVTLATNDTYSLGCLVLGYSLRRVNTSAKLAVMVSIDVSNPMRTQLAQVFDVIQEVNILDSNDPINLTLLGRPDLNVTFTKLHCWRLTDFEKAVFLDADTLVLQNVDELFDREELSAAPDAGWPDCFNSGVFVYRPSLETYEKLLAFATSQGSFDGGDQGLLNMFFKNWAHEDISKHLPFIYNVVSQAFYSYLPAFTKFKDTVKIVHFIGAVKPWHHSYDTKTRTVHPLPGTGHSQEFLQVWWNVFMEYVQPNLDPALAAELTRRLIPLWPPPEHEECVDNHCHNYNRPPEQKPPRVEDTVHAVVPFKPPDVEKVFYEVDKSSPNKSDSDTDTSIEENIVEIKVIPRSYSELESHYTEEPISQINPSNPPAVTYNAPWITEGWEKGTKGPDSKPPDFTVVNKTKESVETKNEYKSKENEISIIKPASESSHKVEEEPTNVGERPESPVGLVGELASMSIHGSSGPAPLVPDHLRKMNWERGQIDYLGQDSFENIQRKIDQTLQTQSAPALPLSSPFAKPTTELMERASMPVVEPARKDVVEVTPKSTPIKVTATSKVSSPPRTQSKPEPKPAEPKKTTAVNISLSSKKK